MNRVHMIHAVRASQLSQCVSVRVGAVIVMNGRVVSTGENNTVDPDCRCNECNKHMLTDDGKLSKIDRPDHSAWSNDNEVHAEMKALLRANTNGIVLKNAELYTTCSPCTNCAKHIEWYVANKAISAVYYLDKYDRGNDEWIARLQKYGCKVVQIKREEFNSVVDFSKLVFNNNE